MQELDYAGIAKELMRILRGKTSQRSLNQKLGYGSNQAYRWESGRREIAWLDLSRVCRLKKIRIEKILKEELGYFGNVEDTAELVRHLKGPGSIKNLSSTTGISVSILSKWINGKSRPGLAQVFRVIDLTSFCLLDILNRLADISNLSQVRLLQKKSNLKKNLIYDHPISSLILAFLETGAASRGEIDKWLRANSGENFSNLDEILGRMREAEFIEQTSQGHYSILNPHADTRGNLAGSIRLKKHWLERALLALNEIDSKGDPAQIPHHFPHQVFAVSEQASELLRKATYEYLSSCRQIMLSDRGPKNQIRILNLQNVLVGKRSKS